MGDIIQTLLLTPDRADLKSQLQVKLQILIIRRVIIIIITRTILSSVHAVKFRRKRERGEEKGTPINTGGKVCKQWETDAIDS